MASRKRCDKITYEKVDVMVYNQMNQGKITCGQTDGYKSKVSFFYIILCYNQLILVHVERGEKLYPNFNYGNMNIIGIFIVRKNVMGNCA